MNHLLRAKAEQHATFLNTLQTAILYDLCEQADEEGESKPNVAKMAFRWRVHEKTVRWMLKELEVARLISREGQRVIVNPFPEASPGPIVEVSEAIKEPLVKPSRPKKVFDPMSPPDPGSISGFWEKLKIHWWTRWKAAPIPGYIERSMGEVVRTAMADGGGNLPLIERAFVNFVQAAKDSEAGKISLRNFASTWPVWVDGNATKDDARSFIKEAIEL